MSRKFSNLESSNKELPKLKAINKFTKIPSEISNFFSEKRCPSIMSDFARLLESLTINNRQLRDAKRENCRCRYACKQTPGGANISERNLGHWQFIYN